MHLDRLSGPGKGGCPRADCGAALPLALLGLIIVTLLITTLLLTATTELAISDAQQDATVGLYTAEAGLQSYVAQIGPNLAPTGSPQSFTPAGGTVAERVSVGVTFLSALPHPGKPAWPDDSTFALIAEPANGGRAVHAFTRLTSDELTVGEIPAVWSGSNLKIGGNVTISKKSSLCATDSAAHAVEHAVPSVLNIANNAMGNMVGDTAPSLVRPSRFVETTFGTTLEGLIAMADLKLTASSVDNTIQSLGSVVDWNNPGATPENWGCPVDVFLKNDGTTACENDTDKTWFPLIAIDASKADGSWGDVSFNLSHGQGMLVVYNGNLSFQGQIVFKGVILVEGGFSIKGTGNSGLRFEGSVIGLGMGPDSTEFVIPQDLTGTPTIRYNGCAIQEMQDAFEARNKYVRVVRPTYGWSEIVR